MSIVIRKKHSKPFFIPSVRGTQSYANRSGEKSKKTDLYGNRHGANISRLLTEIFARFDHWGKILIDFLVLCCISFMCLQSVSITGCGVKPCAYPFPPSRLSRLSDHPCRLFPEFQHGLQPLKAQVVPASPAYQVDLGHCK